MSNKKRVHLFISGTVQGVFFRASTVKKAKKIGVTGWVKNLPDRRVEALLEGNIEDVDKMIEWLKKGPSSAKVENVEIKEGEYKGEFNNFKIKY